jgi:hypothetical protein
METTEKPSQQQRQFPHHQIILDGLMMKVTALSAVVVPRSEQLHVWVTRCSVGLVDHEVGTPLAVIIAW